MSEKLNIPTVGRIVHFFPAGKDNVLDTVAAIVTESTPDDSAICITVFPKAEPPVPMFTVLHKSTASKGEAYWDWPANASL
jgi:hypothetical protein